MPLLVLPARSAVVLLFVICILPDLEKFQFSNDFVNSSLTTRQSRYLTQCASSPPLTFYSKTVSHIACEKLYCN